MLAETSENDRQSRRGKIAEHRTPSAIAAGVAFGIAIGLIPKDSMLVLLLLLFIATLPIHQLLACGIAITLTLVSPWTNHMVHPVGENVLKLPFVGAFLSRLYAMPLMPWLRLENTLVAGASVVGLCTWLPSYMLSLWFSNRAEASQLDQEISTLASNNLRHRRSSSAPKTEPKHHPESLALNGDSPTNAVAVNAVADSAIESQSDYRSNHPDDLELANLVLQVQETMMEAARVREGHLATEPSLGRPGTPTLPMAESHHGAGMSIISPVGLINTEHVPSSRLSESAVQPSVPDGNVSVSPIANSQPGRQFFNHAGSKEESLRNILKHIHSLRESKKETEKTA